MKTATAIRQAVLAIPEGRAFSVAQFLGMGARSAIDVALHRLVQEGFVQRVCRGLYVRPEINPEFGPVPLGSRDIVSAISRETGEIVEITGTEAERRMGLTTQQQTRPVYLTSGPSRTVRSGRIAIEMKHVSPKKLRLAGTPAGVAMLALWNRGKTSVGSSEIETVKQCLGTEGYSELMAAIPYMPGWLSAALMKHERMVRHG